MTFTRPLSKLSKGDVSIAGGKGASLGEMIHAGIPVPDGFVVLTNAFEQFSMNEEISDELKAEINKSFRHLDCQFVAVRSSATSEDSAEQAWAGQLDSFLNVEEINILEKVQLCWASLFSSRAVQYRHKHNLANKNISVAVIVQKMVQAEFAGVAFSVHPVTQDQNHMLIESVSGLGEKLVSGELSPDSYVIEKETLKISSSLLKNTSEQHLTETQIFELSELVLRIENYYGFPCDIEWAYQAGKFYILQCRPITTLEDSYRLIFSSEGYSVMNAFNLKFAGYIAGGGMLTCENNEKVSLYIKESDLIHYGEIGLETFSSKQKTQALMRDINLLIERLTDLNIKFNPDAIQSYSNEDLAGYYEAAQESAIKFLSLYCLLESHHTFAAEKIIEQYMHEHSDIYEDKTVFDLIYDTKEINDSKVKNLVENIRTLAHFKLEANKKAFSGQRGILREIKRSIKLFDNDDIQILSWKEIRDALLYGISHDIFERLQEERKNFFVIESDNEGKNDFFVELEAKIKIDAIKPRQQNTKNAENVNLLKGQVASRGVYTGKALVLPYITSKENSDYQKASDDFKAGDILVTKNTVPEIIELIQKAGAIVTEEGGITCHGAVVAREFKIPGIVGVERATEIIKTGNKIEVDAINGFVRILEV